MLAIPNSKTITKTILIALSFLFISPLLYSHYYGYENVCRNILTFLNKQHQLNLFKEQYLTLSLYSKINTILIVAVIIYCLIAYLILRNFEDLRLILLEIRNSIKTLFKNIVNQIICYSNIEKKALFSLLTIFTLSNIYNAITYPISYDEVWTFINFSKKPLLAAFYYPAPNNHILFSLLTNISTLISIDYKMEIRIISIIFGTTTIYLMYSLLRKYFNFSVAIISSTIFSFSYPILLYSMQARGYILELFFFLISVHCLFVLINEPNKKPYNLIFIIANVCAFYTLPSYLYAFISQLCIIGIISLRSKQYHTLKTFSLYTLYITIITLVLYSPIFLLKGFSSISNNTYTKPLALSKIQNSIYPHLSSTSNWLFGIDKYGLVLIVFLISVLLIVIFRKKEENNLLLFSLIILLLPIAFIYIQRVIPFERTWIHISIATSIAIAFIIEYISKKLKQSILVPSSIVISIGIGLFSIYTFNTNHIGYHNNYAIDKHAGNFVMDKDFSTVQTIFNQNTNFSCDCFETFIVYRQIQINKHIFDITRKTIDYSKKYDLLILSAEDTIENNYLANYCLLYKDENVKLLKRHP